MKKINKVISQVIPLEMNNVDTDMIIPAQFLTQVSREGYGQHLFQRLKEQDPNFVFNKDQYQSREILIAGDNFGCGSSREHAVWALMQAGIRVVIAESFSDIFFNNAAKNGLLTITQSPKNMRKIKDAIDEHDVMFTVDLSEQIIKCGALDIFKFDYDPFRRSCLLKGQDDLDYLLEVCHA